MKHYAVIGHEIFKEPEIYFYQGTYETEELETLTIESIQKASSTKYANYEEAEEDIYIDHILESDSPIKVIYL